MDEQRDEMLKILKRVLDEVSQELDDCPEIVKWDHLPKPTWRHMNLKDEK